MISYTDSKGSPKRKKKPQQQALTIYAELRGAEPKIWRRIFVSNQMELGHFHDVLQLCFNWFDYQMHRFTIGESFYGNPYTKEGEPMIQDDRDVLFCDLPLRASDSFTYEYFMGDGWVIDLKIEKSEALPEDFKYPHCLAGELGSPPEDCGGIEGFKEIQYSLLHPEEPISQEWIEWLGDYDLKKFDISETNKLIVKLMR